MQGKIKRYGANSGDKINGMIEEYKVAAGGNISAGDFVEYINTTQIGENTRLRTGKYSIGVISGVLLNENTIFILYQESSSVCLYGMLITISDTVITAGTNTQLSPNADTGVMISAVLLSENKVFIAHNNSNRLYRNNMYNKWNYYNCKY